MADMCTYYLTDMVERAETRGCTKRSPNERRTDFFPGLRDCVTSLYVYVLLA
jgi:hypothetical protein